MSADKIKQFAKDIKEENKDYLTDDSYVIKLCEMLIEAVEALEFCKSMVKTPELITHDELMDSCEHAYEKINLTFFRIAGKLNNGK